MEDELLFKIFEAARNYVELKEQSNPLIKTAPRAQEFAFKELRDCVRNFEKMLQEEARYE